jgi:hypothetical protein
VVAREYQNPLRTLSLQYVYVLIQAVRGSPIPTIYVALLRRDALYEFIQFMVEDVPPKANMAIQ